MKRLLVALVVLGVAVSVLDVQKVASSVELPTTVTETLLVGEVGQLTVTAKSYGVFDLETGKLLLSQEEDTPLPIASVTKIFTAAAVLESTISTEEILVLASDVATEGRAGKLAVGEVYTPHELLFPLLLESSNDAAAALVRTVGDVEFAGRVLADGSGLSARNVASTRELASEVRHLYFTMQHLFDVTKLPQYVGKYTGWVNNSPVYDLPGYQGGKHGYTEVAGRTLVAIFTETTLQDRELGYVLLGSEDVRSDTEILREAVKRSVRVQ